MTKPTIFISYSHKDETWKDRLVTQLGVLEMEGVLEVWDDRRIGAGEDWFPKIEQAIDAASVAILMVSADFLTSKFIRGEEVPLPLERREKDGLRVIPVVVKPCPWKRVEWLARMEARPKGRALSAGEDHQIDADCSAIADEVADIIARARQTPRPVAPPLWAPTKFPSPASHPPAPTSSAATRSWRSWTPPGPATRPTSSAWWPGAASARPPW